MMSHMAQPAVLICVALKLEANAIDRALRNVPDVPARVQIIGIGAGKLPQRFSPTEVSLLIPAGLAGALDPKRKCGDIVEDSTGERIHTAETMIATVQQKAQLFEATGTSAVDMETRHIVRVAKESGVPFVAIRAISDTANEP